jgi:uncharacterized membrane protein YfcA
MQIYLPIAETSVNIFLFLGVGAAVGFVSGLLGVGGGFLMTPLLIFLGIPPGIAVATSANQIIASSVSGFIAHWRRDAVDFKMAGMLSLGGVVGALLGIWLFDALARSGQTELLVSLLYVVCLGTVGTLMLIESVQAIRRARAGQARPTRQSGQHYWLHGLPFKMRFRRSKLYISALAPLAIGFAIGMLTATMGVGGGFVLVPALIYLLYMPTSVVLGTSLLQAIVITSIVTILHAVNTRSVDLVLAMLLIVGGVIGAQLGARAGLRLRAEELRALLAGLVLAVAVRLAVTLLLRPDDLYSVVATPLPKP